MTLFSAIEATWPPVRVTKAGAFALPEAPGAGKRVNAAILRGTAQDDDIDMAESAMRQRGMAPLFRIDDGHSTLDGTLAARGYQVVDPVVIVAGDAKEVAADGPDPVTAFPVWPPLAAMHEMWDACGTSAERRMIMCRAGPPKTAILGRTRDTPAGCAFVGTQGDIAMLHALEVLPGFRRAGVARNMVRAAASWARTHGITCFAALTVEANEPARALFASMGMAAVGHYHYREQRTEGDPHD